MSTDHSTQSRAGTDCHEGSPARGIIIGFILSAVLWAVALGSASFWLGWWG